MRRFKTCECCGRFFFANRSNNQSYCQGCKNNSKEKLLSQNTKRNSLIRKLNRNYPYESDDFKSEILIKNGFEPLKKVSGEKKVVLGLITSKTPLLENKEEVIKRIKEASKYIPLERLYLSPQCGFASCEIGNKLTEEEQWNKLKLVKEVAEEVWK